MWSQPGTAVEQPLLSNCWGGEKWKKREVLKLLFISATVQEEIEVGEKVFTVRLEADLPTPLKSNLTPRALLMQMPVQLGVPVNSGAKPPQSDLAALRAPTLGPPAHWSPAHKHDSRPRRPN